MYYSSDPWMTPSLQQPLLTRGGAAQETEKDSSPLKPMEWDETFKYLRY